MAPALSWGCVTVRGGWGEPAVRSRLAQASLPSWEDASAVQGLRPVGSRLRVGPYLPRPHVPSSLGVRQHPLRKGRCSGGQGGGGRGGQPPPECPSRLWGVPRGESSAGLRFTALSCNKATELSPGLRVGVSLTWSVCGELRRGLVGLGAQSAQLVGDADRLVGRGWLCLWARIPTDLDSPAANGASSVTAPVQGWVPPGSGTWLRSAGGTGVPTPGPRTGSSDWQKVTAGWTLWSCWRQTVELTEANV